MKKIISLIIVFILSLSLISCSTSYSGELLHYEEDSIKIQTFYEEIFGSKSDITTDDFSFSFNYVEETSSKNTEEEHKEKITVKGATNYEDGFLLAELKLDGKSNLQSIYATLDGKKKESETTTEKSIMFFESGFLTSAYVFNKFSSKSEDFSYSSQEKTLNQDASFAYEVFEDHIELRAVIEKIGNFLTSFFANKSNYYIYLDGDTMTLVSSFVNSNLVIKIVSDGDEFSTITIKETATDPDDASLLTRSLKITICDEEDIKKPSDKSEYKADLDEDYQ